MVRKEEEEKKNEKRIQMEIYGYILIYYNYFETEATKKKIILV